MDGSKEQSKAGAEDFFFPKGGRPKNAEDIFRESGGDRGGGRRKPRIAGQLFGDTGSEVVPGSATRLVPKIFREEGDRAYFKAKKQELRFLHAWEKSGGNIREALSESGLTMERLKKFLKRKEFRELIADRQRKIALEQGWATAGQWWQYAWEVLEGKRAPSREWVTVWQEMGSRVKPRERKTESSDGGEQVVININGDSIVEAEKRTKMINMRIKNGQFRKEG